MRNPLFPLKSLALLAALSAWAPSPVAAQEKGAETHVPIAASVSSDTLAPGAGAEVRFTFTPKKGYHVNAVPPMAVAFDSASPARNSGKIVIPSDTTTGYLKSSQPVRQPFTLAASAPKGRTALKGVLTYYYCSDAEGWCRKENLPFTLPVTVK
jgi:hypothetical protein